MTRGLASLPRAAGRAGTAGRAPPAHPAAERGGALTAPPAPGCWLALRVLLPPLAAWASHIPLRRGEKKSVQLVSAHL